jgi:hypothetical protein
VITKETIKYVYFIPAISKEPVINKSRAVSETEWTEIQNDFNLDDFVKLNYQSCNICLDGCDEWISIKKNQISHEIRFAKGLNINTISKLQERLARLRIEFKN